MTETAVSRLRDQKQAESRRAFVSRGSHVVRCQRCLLAQTQCICAHRPQVVSGSAFLLLMYQGEVFKPSNTGRLIADTVTDTYAYQWQRVDHQPDLLALLADHRYQPVLVFPHQYAAAERCIDTPQQLPALASGEKIPLFILLDGTWREAKKMFRTQYLQDLPVLGIHPQQASAYHVREAFHEHQLCTVEVGIEVLKMAGDGIAADALQQYFECFRHGLLAAKTNVRPLRHSEVP